MAEAAGSSGGGSSWGPLEIILVLLLGIGFLGKLSGNPVLPPTPTQTPPKTTTPREVPVTCGLSLIHPISKEMVFGAVPVVGSISGCNWNPEGTTALFAQVIDANGLPLSVYTPITQTTLIQGGMSFATTIALTAPASTKTGYLILIPASDPQNKHLSTRVLLTFAQ